MIQFSTIAGFRNCPPSRRGNGTRFYVARKRANLPQDAPGCDPTWFSPPEASQREAPHSRALSKAQAIHAKLGGTGIVDDPVFKPKGMHWRTYYRQVERLREAESRSWPTWL